MQEQLQQQHQQKQHVLDDRAPLESVGEAGVMVSTGLEVDRATMLAFVSHDDAF